MTRWRRLIVAFVAVLVLLMGAGAIAIRSIDPNLLVALAADQVQAATGRDLTIAGPTALALLPRPAVQVEGIAFANAVGGSRPAMLTAKRLELDIALWPLFGGQIKVERIRLVEPDLLLE